MTMLHYDNSVTIYNSVQTMCYRQDGTLFKAVPYRILNQGIGTKMEDKNLAQLRT